MSSVALEAENDLLHTKYTLLVNRFNAIYPLRRRDIHINASQIAPQPSPFGFIGNKDPNAYQKALRTWYKKTNEMMETVIFSIENTPLTPRQSPRKPSARKSS